MKAKITVIAIKKTKNISGSGKRLETIKIDAEIQMNKIATEVQV